MKIPHDQAHIARDKLTDYLLVRRVEDDKSKWLAQVGFTERNPETLEDAILDMLSRYDAVRDRQNEYGEFYRVDGMLIGPDGSLGAVSVWLKKQRDDLYRFITLKPGR